VQWQWLKVKGLSSSPRQQKKKEKEKKNECFKPPKGNNPFKNTLAN
jgi:hypothetical protein